MSNVTIFVILYNGAVFLFEFVHSMYKRRFSSLLLTRPPSIGVDSYLILSYGNKILVDVHRNPLICRLTYVQLQFINKNSCINFLGKYKYYAFFLYPNHGWGFNIGTLHWRRSSSACATKRFSTSWSWWQGFRWIKLGSVINHFHRFYTVAWRPVAGQRPRDKQTCNSRYWVTTSCSHGNSWTTTTRNGVSCAVRAEISGTIWEL
jgi:hypothetical protein